MIEIKEIITDNKDLEYIRNCAESVGMDVTDKTAFTIPFIAEVMRKMNNSAETKQIYDRGYKEGQEALAFHLELCKEEGSIIEIPEGATNGDMVKLVFPDVAIDIHFRMLDDWWNSPYRKEQE